MRITIVDYDPEWPEKFKKESEKLHTALGDVVNEIYHIGSTAVSGMKAKPIIDIILEITSLDRIDAKTFEIENLGYEVMGEFGIPGRRYFRKGGYDRTHQVHAFTSGDPNLTRHLAFRDYLIEHKKIAEEYSDLKFRISKICNNDIEKYCDEKDEFIKYHEVRALKWIRMKHKNTITNRIW